MSSLGESRAGWEQAVGSRSITQAWGCAVPLAAVPTFFLLLFGFSGLWAGARPGTAAQHPQCFAVAPPAPSLVCTAQYECLGLQSHPELEEPVPGDGTGVRRVFGTVGQRKPQGTIPTLSFSSRSPQEEAGLAPNCCHFSPWFSRPPCSGLRGAGKVVPISFPPAL